MGDVPVYNVSMVLLQESFPDRPAFRVVELPVSRAGEGREESARVTPQRRATDRSGV